MQLAIPVFTTIGNHHTLRGEISSGWMGVVYRAIDRLMQLLEDAPNLIDAIRVVQFMMLVFPIDQPSLRWAVMLYRQLVDTLYEAAAAIRLSIVSYENPPSSISFVYRCRHRQPQITNL